MSPEASTRLCQLPHFLDQTAEASLGEYQVIEHADAHQLSRTYQTARQGEVVFTWRRVTRRMIVKENNRGGAAAGRLAKDLSWMDDARVERAD